MAKSNARAQSDYLFNLQVQGDKYARLMLEQKQRLQQLDSEWRLAHDELKELRKKRSEGDQRGGGVNAVRAKMADEQREMMKLENRLSACKTRESKMIALNNELRAKVDQLRANRVLSQTVFEKNQKKLKEIQRQMQECFKISTQIMAERDRILTQANAISTTNIEEQENFDEVYASLANVIRRERENAEAYRKQVLESDPMEASEDFVRGNMKYEDEQQLKTKLLKLDEALVEDQNMIQTINEKLKEFESTFAQLQRQVGVGDYHDLVTIYTKREEENFALFRYVQGLNNEIEQLEEDKIAIEEEKQKFNEEMKEGSANVRKRLMEDLVETRQKILKENSEYERQRASAAREFQPLTRAVDRLYNSLGCNEIMSTGANATPATETPAKRSRKKSEDHSAMIARINSMNDLLAAHGITEGNILQFLAIIEQRSSELIEQFSKRLALKNPSETERASLGAHLKPSDPTRSINIVRSILPEYTLAQSGLATSGAPTVAGNTNTSMSYGVNNMMDDDGSQAYSDDDESDRPMSKAEIQKRAAKSVAALQITPKVQASRTKAVQNKKKK